MTILGRATSRVLAAALLSAAACGPSTAGPVSVVAGTPASGPRPAPLPPPAAIVAGAMPAELYVEVTGVPALLRAANSALGEGAVADAVRAVAADAGLNAEVATRFVQAIESLHVAGLRAGGDLKGGLSSDPSVVRDLVANAACAALGAGIVSPGAKIVGRTSSAELT
jgi:hypothetical protein